MIPTTIVTKLGQMRQRERLLRLTWGGARWLALAVVLLGLCCLIDWIVDRSNETPALLFAVMRIVQIGTWAAALVFLIWLPLARHLSDDELTLAVEEGNPALGHRLISALQLNRPGAKTKGMSQELIGLVTKEAEQEAVRLDFTRVLDHRRLKWTGLVVGPLAAVVLGLFLLMPKTLPALVARQFGGEVDIPRSVEVVNVSRPVWPEGDEVTLAFAVTGEDVDEKLVGKVKVAYQWGSSDEYTLAYDRKEDGKAIFTARVPAAFNDFTFRGRVRDGRSRTDGRIQFKPRPVVIAQVAWVLRPAYIGLKPDGSRYEIEMEKADIAALPGSSARVVVRSSKPVKKATLELLSSQAGGDNEDVLARLPMKLFEKNEYAEATFNVTGEATAYRVRLEDENGFTNLKAPQRNISLLADELPTVAMLKDDRFIDDMDKKLFEENEVEGMPLKLGAAIRIAYRCKSPYGLRKANLKIRVNEGEWLTYPLVEYKQTELSGAFNPERGIFQNSGPGDKVYFHAMNSPDLETEPARQQGGGRFDYETSALKGLKADDQVEYYIEVFDMNPAMDREPGKSTPPMIKRVVNKEDFDRWVLDTLKQEQKLRDLKEAQEKATKGKDD